MEVINLTLERLKDAMFIRTIKEILDNDQLIVYPTDTLYGLGANPYSAVSIDKLNSVKGRESQQNISIAVPDIAGLKRVGELDETTLQYCAKLLPGPITVIVRAGEGAPAPVVSNKSTIGVRMPDNVLSIELLKLTGPLTVTSANRHGGSEPVDIPTAKAALGSEVSMYLDCGPCKFKIPSTILDFSAGEPKILREGTISREELEQRLNIQVD
ncbi:MAG: threonylcarbamoyl-AMP synthase [Thermoplasmata archaeon]|nr:MAG: threonylcarbamoyl-AMP synthase [Thermoplasmata archaeon]